MGGGTAGLEATALVDGHIHQDDARLQQRQIRPRDQLRRRSARDQHAADDQVGLTGGLEDRVAGREDRLHPAIEAGVQLGQPVRVDVEDRHVGALPHGDARRFGPGDPAAQDHDLARRHARDAAQQHARPTPGLEHEQHADIDGHPSRDLAHRRQQGQTPVPSDNGFIGDGGAAGRLQPAGLRHVSGQVQIGEQHMVRLQARDFDGLGLLHLDDHLGEVEHRVGRRQDGGPGRRIVGVRGADALTGQGLHRHLMAAQDEALHHFRDQPDSVFEGLDLLRNANAHL